MNVEKQNLFDVYQGFIRGNMFENLYDNYGRIYDIKPIDKRTELLTYIDMLDFACIDIGLYLDIYSSDNNMIQLYNKIKNEKNSIINEYEEKYGPLDLCSNYLNKTPWIWNKNPWPWEV